jgi:hypothetical protein
MDKTMKVIAFSLWGDDPKYNIGAVRNMQIASTLFPTWECRFYVRPVNGSYPPAVMHLQQYSNTKVVFVNKPGDWTCMFDRFEAAADPRVDVMLSRDCDSRLSQRERDAVDEWLKSDKRFHIMRDHPWHSAKILGGMWGAKKGILPDIKQMIAKWNQEDRWQTDQEFLASEVYDRVVDDAMIHASFHRFEIPAIPFPTPRVGLEFVGEVYDENENTVQEHTEFLARMS